MAAKLPSIYSTLYSLRRVLRKFVEDQMRQSYGEEWLSEISHITAIREHELELSPERKLLRAILEPERSNQPDLNDCLLLLRIIQSKWDEVFVNELDNVDQAALTILLAVGGKWAARQALTQNETHLIVSCATRMVLSVLKGEEAETSTLEESWRMPSHELSVTGKYRPLYDYLAQQPYDITMTFEEIEALLGEELPPSASNYQAWWANEDPYRTMMIQKRAWLLAGFKAFPDLAQRRVTFRRR